MIKRHQPITRMWEESLVNVNTHIQRAKYIQIAKPLHRGGTK